jgi:hypothetical protein
MRGQVPGPAILLRGKNFVYLLAMRLHELGSSLDAIMERKKTLSPGNQNLGF